MSHAHPSGEYPPLPLNVPLGTSGATLFDVHNLSAAYERRVTALEDVVRSIQLELAQLRREQRALREGADRGPDPRLWSGAGDPGGRLARALRHPYLEEDHGP